MRLERVRPACVNLAFRLQVAKIRRAGSGPSGQSSRSSNLQNTHIQALRKPPESRPKPGVLLQAAKKTVSGEQHGEAGGEIYLPEEYVKARAGASP